MAVSWLRRKSVEVALREVHGQERQERQARLHRSLGFIALTSLGLGATIGTGVFIMSGAIAHNTTGPALTLSYLLGGVTCACAGLCYAELAAMVPVAGSAYLYAYLALGELTAWLLGWVLALEYALGAAWSAHNWSVCFQDFLAHVGVHLPAPLVSPALDYTQRTATGAGWVDLPAAAVALAVGCLLVRGVTDSVRINTGMVMVKLAIILFVVFAGVPFVEPSNWLPFAPHGYTGISLFGAQLVGEAGPHGEPLGVIAGAAAIFYAYVGFDSVSVHAEEAKAPQHDVPWAILSALGICTLLYIAVAGVLTGMVRYDHIDIRAPIPAAFTAVGMPWAQFLIDTAILASLTSVLVTLMLCQPRIWLAMARDGLLPYSLFGSVHPRFGTPLKGSLTTVACVTALAGCFPLHFMAQLVQMGTLLAFATVCTAVLVLRKTAPRAPRPFRCPLSPLVPAAGIALCSLLMLSLPAHTWRLLAAWVALGLLVYFAYGARHSTLRVPAGPSPPPP